MIKIPIDISSPWFKKIFTTLIKAIRMQLFMTIIALPILVAWGIPTSALTIVGNIIFAPILTLFLMLCTLIFITELCHVPNDPLLWLLKVISSLWIKLLELPTNTWFLCFSLPPYWLLLMPPCITLASLFYKKLTSLYIHALFMVFVLAATIMLMKMYEKKTLLIEKIPCNKGNVVLIRTEGITILIDPGYMGQRLSASSWIEYTLIPRIIKKTGSNKINHLIILQPNKTLFEALPLFFGQCTINNLYLPWFTSWMPLPLWRQFSHLKKIAIQSYTSIIPVHYKRLIFENRYLSLFLCPTNRTIHKNNIQYEGYEIHISYSGTTEIIQPVANLTINTKLRSKAIHYLPTITNK